MAYLRLVFPGIFLGWYYVAYPCLFSPSIFLGMVLCGIIAPSLFKYFPGDYVAPFPKYFHWDGIVWHRHIRISTPWGWYYVAYLRLVFPGIFLGMVLCGISAPSFFKYLHLMWHICTFLSKNIFLGMVWHICTICTNQLSKHLFQHVPHCNGAGTTLHCSTGI